MSNQEWAVVTGASGGIGKEFASLFAANKINVVLAARDKAELEKTAAQLDKQGVTTFVFIGDLSLPKTAESFYQLVRSKKLNVVYLINNAGFGDYGFFTDTSSDKEQSMIGLNIATLTFLTKVFSRDMKQAGRGYIVNLASTAAFFPGPLMAVYYATKAYVLRFSVAVNNELSGSGVSVTALCPGPTKTKFAAAAQAGKSGIFQNKNLPSAQEVAEYGYKAMLAKKPVAVFGWQNKVATSLSGLIPVELAAKAVRRIQSRR